MGTRSKRRRLLQSYISPPRPDLPATFESLSDDPLTTILEFVGRKSYGTYAGINKHCKEVYLTTKGMTKKTYLYGYGPLSAIKDRIERSNMECRALDMRFGVSLFDEKLFHGVGIGVVYYNRRDVMEWALGENDKHVLRGICFVAAWEERFDILVEVLDNVKYDEDVERFVFRHVDDSAAYRGKLNVLKWLELKGISINKENCESEAAKFGQLHILQWLREEKALE